MGSEKDKLDTWQEFLWRVISRKRAGINYGSPERAADFQNLMGFLIEILSRTL